MKTRSQLAKEGVLLEGPVVLSWFKLQSDNCSVPTKLGKMFLNAKKFSWPCQIHDFMYYLPAIQYAPHSPKWQGARLQADARLKENIRLVAKNRFAGWMYSRIYFRSVRIGGRGAMRKPKKNPVKDKLAVPPGPKSREELKLYLEQPLTPLAKHQFAQWEKEESR